MVRTIVRWVARVVGVALALVVLAVGGVLIAMHTDWGRDHLRAMIERRMTGLLWRAGEDRASSRAACSAS